MGPSDGVDERIKHQGHLLDQLYVPCMVEQGSMVGDRINWGYSVPWRRCGISPAPFGRPAHFRRLTRQPPAQCARSSCILTS